MDSRVRLEAWLKPVPADKRPADPFELAIAQGMVAQETIAGALLSFFELDTDVPKWLTIWAASLTADQIEEIKTRREAEEASLREDIELLLGGDPSKWSDAERTHAEEASRRLTAVNLVLRARNASAERVGTTTFPPKPEMAATAAA